MYCCLILFYFRSAPPSPSHITGGELSIADSLSRETSPSPPVSSSDQQQDEVCLANSISNQIKSPNKISHTNGVGVLHYVSSTGNNCYVIKNDFHSTTIYLNILYDHILL